MPLSLNNSKDLIANSLGLISGNEILDVGNNIEAFALALAGKAPQAAVYTKQETYSNYQINSLFDAVDDELDAVQTTLNNKAPKLSPTFEGTVTAPNITLGTADLQTTLNNKAGLTDPLVVFTGTVSADGLQADDITLGTADLQTTLNNKANKQDPQLDGTVTLPSGKIKFTSNLAGDKISLYEDQYSLGIAPYTMTQTIPANTNDFSFKWYGGEDNVATLTGNGILNVSQKVTTQAITLGENDLQTTLNGQQTAISTLQTTVGSQGTTIGTQGTAISTLQTTVGTQGTAISTLQTALDGKQGTIQTTEGTNLNTDFGNYQRVRSSADGIMRIQRFDNDGPSPSNTWKDQLKLDWNEHQKKTYVTVDYMIANESLTVAGEDLMSYAKKSYVDNEILEVYDEVDTKVDKFNPTFVGVVTMPNGSDLQAKLDEKAVKINPTLTGTVTINGTNLLSMFDERAPKASPTFTGTLTTPAITLNGASLQTTLTNMNNSINAKQSQIQSLDISNGTYTTALGNQKQILTDGPRLIIQHNNFSISQPGSGQWLDLLETTWDTVSNIPIVSTTGIASANGIVTSALTCTGPATVAGNTNLIGNLSVTGFYPHKPYVAFYFTGGQISSSNVPGYVPRVNITMDAREPNTLYAFTFTPAHPNGTNYMVMVTARTGSSSTYFYCTANATANNRFLVWCRTNANTLVNGEYYVQTIP